MRFILMLLVAFALGMLLAQNSATAQYRSYGQSYHRPSYSYGHSYHKPSYSYSYGHSYGYTAPSYSYSAPSYDYKWYEGTWYQGRWYKAGHYYWDGHCWYLKGYGAYSGEAKAAGPPPAPAGLTAQEIATLRSLLKDQPEGKNEVRPLSPEELSKLKEILVGKK